jgi:hypothetical protein
MLVRAIVGASPSISRSHWYVRMTCCRNGSIKRTKMVTSAPSAPNDEINGEMCSPPDLYWFFHNNFNAPDGPRDALSCATNDESDCGRAAEIYLRWLIPSAKTSPAAVFSTTAHAEMMALTVSPQRHRGSGLLSCTRTVATMARRAPNVMMQQSASHLHMLRYS